MGRRFTNLILIILASSCMISCGPRDRSDSDGSERGAQPGARLFIAGRESVMVAVDEKALNDLATALASGSDRGETLIESGRVFTVPNNTRVRILEIKTGMVKIRMIEGERLMQEGWVHERWIE